MLKDSVWNSVLEYYNIKENEFEKENICSMLYDVYYMIRSERAMDLIDEILESKYLHTYVCVDCMEKALGRKLTKEDLIGENIPFNEEFEESYFK